MAADRTVAQEAAESALVELAKPEDERERGTLFALLKGTLVATATGVASGSAAEVAKELINDLNVLSSTICARPSEIEYADRIHPRAAAERYATPLAIFCWHQPFRFAANP